MFFGFLVSFFPLLLLWFYFFLKVTITLELLYVELSNATGDQGTWISWDITRQQLINALTHSPKAVRWWLGFASASNYPQQSLVEENTQLFINILSFCYVFCFGFFFFLLLLLQFVSFLLGH